MLLGSNRINVGYRVCWLVGVWAATPLLGQPQVIWIQLATSAHRRANSLLEANQAWKSYRSLWPHPFSPGLYTFTTWRVLYSGYFTAAGRNNVKDVSNPAMMNVPHCGSFLPLKHIYNSDTTQYDVIVHNCDDNTSWNNWTSLEVFVLCTIEVNPCGISSLLLTFRK